MASFKSSHYSVEPPSRIRYYDVEAKDDDDDEGMGNGEGVPINRRRRRRGRLLSLQGASNKVTTSSNEGGGGTGGAAVVVMDPFLYTNVAIFLAWKHVQERNGSIIPSLPQRLDGCDMDWTLESRDTQFSKARGVRALINATTEPLDDATITANRTSNSSTITTDDDDDWQFPFAVVGAVYSSVSLPITMLGNGHGLPQISATATSAALEYAPYFARTIPKNDAEALALMLYYKSIGVSHMACLYIKDAWGSYYATDIQNAAKPLGIEVVAFAFDNDNRESIRSALKQLKQSGVRYVYAIMFSWKPVLDEAVDLEVISNPAYSWIGAEMIEWTSATLEFNRSNPNDLRYAKALRGVGSLLLDGGSTNSYNAAFENAMNNFATNTSLQQEFIQTYAPEDRHIFNNYTFEYHVDYFFQKAAYDALYSLAIASCQTPGLFTGPELYESLIQLEFDGVTGHVQFDKTTGTRKADSVMVRVDNVYWDEERSDEDFIRLGSKLAVTISQGSVQQISPWRYYDNSTNIPLSIPELSFDENLMPLAAQIVGWTLAGLVVCLSLVLTGWTWYNRNLFVVKAGQPLFLTQLCIGTMIMALAVIPMGMQGTETSTALDAACMAVPWLLFLGFVIAFSALFSKTWRLNQLMNSGLSMRRIKVQPKDVIWPFMALMTLNVVCLVGWTFASPLQYTRIAISNVDRWGRSVEGYGQCKSPDNNYLYFLVPIILFDFVGMATATYQSYKARNLPTILSESSYLALAMASLLETFLLGGPIFFMVMDNPTASFLVGTCLVCITSMTMLLPIFIPKYQNRNVTQGARAGSVVSSQSFRASKAPSSRSLGGSTSLRLDNNSFRNMDDSKSGFMYISRSLRDSSVSDMDTTHNAKFGRGCQSFKIGNSTTGVSRASMEKRISGLDPVLET